MDEKLVESKFKKLKKLFVKRLGKKALYNDELECVGKKLFKSSWNGVHAQDGVVFKPGFQIINTSHRKEEGEHWVALYVEDNTMFVYDSYARPSRNLLKTLTKRAKKNKIVVCDSDRSDKEQRDNTEICGALCCAWLVCVQNYGIDSAMKV